MFAEIERAPEEDTYDSDHWPCIISIATNIREDTNITLFNYVSQFTAEKYCFADGRCLFKQPQSVI